MAFISQNSSWNSQEPQEFSPPRTRSSRTPGTSLRLTFGGTSRCHSSQSRCHNSQQIKPIIRACQVRQPSCRSDGIQERRRKSAGTPRPPRIAAKYHGTAVGYSQTADRTSFGVLPAPSARASCHNEATAAPFGLRCWPTTLDQSRVKPTRPGGGGGNHGDTGH